MLAMPFLCFVGHIPLEGYWLWIGSRTRANGTTSRLKRAGRAFRHEFTQQFSQCPAFVLGRRVDPQPVSERRCKVSSTSLALFP